MKRDGNFNFHPRCRKLGVTHICFADDLLMFCRADLISVKLLHSAFIAFSKASGLQANPDKSTTYFAGVNTDAKQEILEYLGYDEGTMPFRYLGVPLSSKKLTLAQYLALIEKITARMKCWSTSLLSYAGRLQLIKSVIFGLQTYWSQIIVLPKKLIKAIETACRTFLWTGNITVSKKALVALERICTPYAVGGLNITNLDFWNKVAIIKQLWALERKKDSLWIRWIHTYYIKQESLENCQIPKQAAWVTRKIIAARKIVMQASALQGDLEARLSILLRKEGGFSIRKAYLALLPQSSRVEWKSLILQHSIHPRHKFILWLAAQQKLATVDRLQRFGIQVPMDCVFCKAPAETFEHMFSTCPTKTALIKRLFSWLKTPVL